MDFIIFAKNCANFFKDILRNKKIIVIANTQKDTLLINTYDTANADLTEFFTELEFAQISQGLTTLDVCVKYYYNELSFINDVLNNKLTTNNIVVLNFSRNGIHQGKKSLIPSFCSLMKIPFTGSNAFTISLCRNKFVFTKYLTACGIEMPMTYAIDRNKKWLTGEPISEYILKPIAESGSIGVTGDTIGNGIDENFFNKFINNDSMIVQECLCGDEYEVPIFEKNGQYFALGPVKLQITQNQKIKCLTDMFSKENDYTYTDSELSTEMNNYILETALSAARLLNIQNYGRIDFKFKKEKNLPYIIDVACSPFLTKNSSFTYYFENQELKYEDIFRVIIHSALS